MNFVFDGRLANFEKKHKAAAGCLDTWIGPQGRKVYTAFAWANGEKEDTEKVMKKFELYVRPWRKEIIARCRLLKRH